jgi:hypothetical protein
MKAREIYMYVLGAIVVIGFFIIVRVVFKIEMPTANREIALILVGVLASKFGDVVSYFFGSSKGSSDKTEIMNKNNPK